MMFIYQAQLAFKIWHNILPKVNETLIRLMIRIAVVGDIGSGKSYVAKQFGYPVFNADAEVNKLYKKNKKCYKNLKKAYPRYITSFPIKKNNFANAIISNKNNLKKLLKLFILKYEKNE